MDEKLKELTLMILHMTAWKEKKEDTSLLRSRKNYPVDIIDKLTEEGYISAGEKTKSVYISEKGAKEAEKLKKKYFKSRKTKTSHKSGSKAGSYVFEVELEDIEPRIWRRIAVPETATLEILAYIILTAFGWMGGHLHGFFIGDREYGMAEFDDFGTMSDEKKITLNKLTTDSLREFLFVYDFGDDWRHIVKHVETLPAEQGSVDPECLDGERAAPPDDCGSVPGYYDVLEALENKQNPSEKQKERLEWLGEEYDPEYFDKDGINKELKDMKAIIRFHRFG